MLKHFWVLVAVFLGLGALAAGLYLVGNVAPPTQDPYAPSKFGIPETLGGYKVLAVVTETNFPCMLPGEKRLVLQTPQTTSKDALQQLNPDAIKRDLQKYQLQQFATASWDITGPHQSREQVLKGLEQSAQFFKSNGCLRTGGPVPTP
jgi:hypothetical protein